MLASDSRELPALLAQAGDVHYSLEVGRSTLYDPAPPRRAGQLGRPRLKGERLPNLSIVAEDPSTAWTLSTVEDWYGSAERTVEVASATALWYSTGLLPAVPIRWVLVRDPKGEFATQALLGAPTLVPGLSRSWGGLSCVGRWRRPSRKHVDTWAWKRKGSGRS
jgi:hypothetical protein